MRKSLSCPQTHLPAVQQIQPTNLGQTPAGNVFSQRLTLRHIASRLLGTTTVKHKLKRLQNFLDKITLDEQFGQSYVQTLFCLPYMSLRSRGKITVLIDATSLKDEVWILAASISYRGRSLPIYLRQWKGGNKNYDYWKRMEEFTLQLKGLLPDDLEYELIGDGGFEGARMFALRRWVGWDQVIRINGSYSIKTPGGQEFIQLILFDDGYYRQVMIGKTNPTEGLNLAVCSLADSERRWYLATTVDPETAAADYKRRMWIEHTFKDLESVLKCQTYTAKFPAHRRLEKLVALSCLSYGFQLCLGTPVTVVPPSEEKRPRCGNASGIFTAVPTGKPNRFTAKWWPPFVYFIIKILTRLLDYMSNVRVGGALTNRST